MGQAQGDIAHLQDQGLALGQGGNPLKRRARFGLTFQFVFDGAEVIVIDAALFAKLGDAQARFGLLGN